MEAGDGFGRVKYDGARIERRVVLQLLIPWIVVQLVDDAVEGALLGQGPAGIDWDQIDAVLIGVPDQRRLDEALLFLRRERVADAVALAVTGVRGCHCFFVFSLTTNNNKTRNLR